MTFLKGIPQLCCSFCEPGMSIFIVSKMNTEVVDSAGIRGN